MQNKNTLIPNREELEEILSELYLDKLENDCIDLTDDSEEVSFIKSEYWLTPDDQAQELGFKDFADFTQNYLRENFEVSQPNWVADWGRANMRGAR